jgi:glutamyl-tRNA synthetase
MEGDVSGYAEPGLAEYEADDLVQFERVGFARVDGIDAGDVALLAFFAHP